MGLFTKFPPAKKFRKQLIMESITIDKAQELRKQGYTILLNKALTKVLNYSKDKQVIEKSFTKGNKIFYPLVKVHVSKQEIKEALQELSLGLNCR